MTIAAHRQIMRANGELDEAARASATTMKFLHGHMAAIRAAAAVISGHAAPRPRRLRPVWDQLADVGPQWGPWAAYFADSASLRAGIEAGQITDLPPEQVDQMIATVTEFVAVAVGSIHENEAMITSVSSQQSPTAWAS